MELRNPFAMKNGKMITIYDLDESSRGLKCDCACPMCNGTFEAKMGEIRQWHFAHSGEPCDRTKQYVNSAFMLVMQLLLDEGRMAFPSYEQYGKLVFKSGTISIKDAEIKYRNDGMAEAIILDENQLALRIALDMEYCAGGILRAVDDMSTMLIDLTDINGLNSAELKEKVCRDLKDKTWIYSKRAERELQQKNTIEHTGYGQFEDDEETEEARVVIKDAKQYNPYMVTCSLCRARGLKEDAMWGRNSRRYYCHSCVESKGLDWREL